MTENRLLWFGLGFIFRDFWIDRRSLSSQLTEKFNSLETRVTNLESFVSNKPTSSQDEGNLGRSS